jgi:hypothetical protein
MVLAPGATRLQIVGIVFLCVVVAVVSYTHQLIIPLFLGLLTWGKAFVKSLTPKLTLLLVKNSLVTQARRLLVQASTHVLVKSHRPWRRWLNTARLLVISTVNRGFAQYLNLPLWVRTAIALGVLVTTAGSSFAVFALLIIPQPVLNWLRKQVMGVLKKLGVARFFATLWKFAMPARLRERWHLYVKWTVGRRQVRVARHLYAKVKRSRPPGRDE